MKNNTNSTRLLPIAGQVSETTSTSTLELTKETDVRPTASINTENEATITTIDELDELADRRAFNPIAYDKEGTLIPPNIDVTSKKVTKVTTINKSTYLHVTKNPKKSDENRQVQDKV